MTKEQFEEFLKDSGIFSGFNNSPITSRYSFDIPDIWLEQTKKLIEDLIVLGWDKQLFQCKEKWGTFRFYIGYASQEVHERIRETEKILVREPY